MLLGHFNFKISYTFVTNYADCFVMQRIKLFVNKYFIIIYKKHLAELNCLIAMYFKTNLTNL